MALLEIINLSKRFDHADRPLEVVRQISFELQMNEVIGIVGPTGCGKTTLLRILAGLEMQSSGQVIANEEFEGNKRLTGMLFQAPTLLSWRNVFENVSLPFELGRLETSDEGMIQSVINSVGLNGFENYYPSQISGGMQARASLARALVLRPAILLLDEPFASIDEITRFTLCALLVKVLEEFSSSAVLVTHSLDEAILLSNKIIVLSPRPATIVGIVEIELAKEIRLREPEHPNLVGAKKRVRQYLAESRVSG